MAAQKLKITEVPRHQFSNFLEKALEFYQVMIAAMDDRQWDAAVLMGVHASISITDAVLVHKEGIRSISQRHEDVVKLLRQHFHDLSGQDSRLLKIINYKNLVSYQPIILSEKEAREFAKGVERYFEWAKRLLP